MTNSALRLLHCVSLSHIVFSSLWLNPLRFLFSSLSFHYQTPFVRSLFPHPTPPPLSPRFPSWWPPLSVVCLTKLSVAVCQSHINSQPWGWNRAGWKKESLVFCGMDFWLVCTCFCTYIIHVYMSSLCANIIMYFLLKETNWPLLLLICLLSPKPPRSPSRPYFILSFLSTPSCNFFSPCSLCRLPPAFLFKWQAPLLAPVTIAATLAASDSVKLRGSSL